MLDLTYVEALNLLEQEAPPDFKNKYDQEMYKRKHKIMGSLPELTLVDQRLTSYIDWSQKHRAGKLIMNRELLGIDDDIRKARQEQTKIKKQIVGYLEQAVELGMNNEASTFEPLTGMIFNVPVYISKMCEKYGIES